MPITLTNAVLLNLDPIDVSFGALRIDGGVITAAGADAAPAPGDETIDCRGAVLLPGLVNGHTHLYSALAPGMPMPAKQPRNFREILEFIWWRLDRALEGDSIEVSGRIGALDALRCGTTTLIDHHASPACIDGSLDRLEKGIADLGLRAVLCYETTDRNGPAGFEAGLAENRRYLDQCRLRGADRFAALVGAHAAFTLSDSSLRACVELAAEYDAGVHIHVAEDPCDDALCREQYGAPLIRRLEKSGLLPAPEGDETGNAGHVAAASILAHGTHLPPDDADRISNQVAGFAHNPRSNMNNSVGYAPVAHMSRVQLGTDGIGGDMFTEARHTWFKARDAAFTADSHVSGPRPVTPARVLEMLAHSARVAGRLLGRTLGRLAPQATADVVITDYVPATPLDAEKAAAHFIFALGPQHVRHVIVDGQWLLKDRHPTRLNEQAARKESVPIAQALWARMEALKP